MLQGIIQVPDGSMLSKLLYSRKSRSPFWEHSVTLTAWGLGFWPTYYRVCNDQLGISASEKTNSASSGTKDSSVLFFGWEVCTDVTADVHCFCFCSGYFGSQHVLRLEYEWCRFFIFSSHTHWNLRTFALRLVKKHCVLNVDTVCTLSSFVPMLT